MNLRTDPQLDLNILKKKAISFQIAHTNFYKNKYSRLNVEGFKKDYHNYLKERSTLKVVKTEKSIRNVRLNFDQDSELFNEKFVPTGSHLEKLFYCLNLLSILIDVPEEPSEDPNYRDQIKAKWKENCSLQKLQRKILRTT